MAEQSNAEAVRELKKSLHWISEEVDRLGTIWCAVSTEKGGAGASQRLDGMWKKIFYKYHNDIPPPPVPTDKAGNECQPRNMPSLTSKWKRARRLMAVYMKCHMLAVSNPQSGEDAQGVVTRAMKMYRTFEPKDFPHITTYDLIKEEPKWCLDTQQLRTTVQQRAGAAVGTVRARLEKEKVKEPTVAGTKKPEGVKRARRTMKEMSQKEKEVVKEEAALSKYLESLTKKGHLGVTILSEGRERTRVLQERVDDELMAIDTTGMSEAKKEYYELRQNFAMERLHALQAQKLQERIDATEAAVTAAAAAAAIASLASGGASATDRSTDPVEGEVEREDDRDEEDDGDEDEEENEGFNGSEEEFEARVRNLE